MAAAVEQLFRRLQRLKTLRQPHEKVWRDCFDHSFPIRGSGLQGDMPMTAQQAQDRKARLLHSVSTDAGRTLAAALVSGAVPSSSVWALLSVTGADDAAKAWLDEKGKQLHEEVHASVFDSVVMECALDMVAAGWFALYVDADKENGGFIFQQWPISSVYAATSVPGGLVDTVFREYSLTAEQCVNEFGIDKVSALTAKKSVETPDESVRICHAIYPRSVYMVDALMGKNMKFASCHFEVDSKRLLRESGYPEMPVVVPRWSLIPDTPYAVGPMFDALPDARELNELHRMDKMNAELAIAGMWIAEDDGVLNPRSVKIGPRKIIVANSVDSMKQLSAGGDWQLSEKKIAQKEAAIRRTLMADQLQPMDGPNMTATEVHVRVGMIRQLLAPIYGRLQAEWLAPMVERCFGLMYRAGVFGPAPESIAGRAFKVKYNNPLARAQKLEDATAIERHNNYLRTIAEAKPEVMDGTDFDKQSKEYAEAVGVPMSTLRDKDSIAALRDERAKQQQAAQQQANQQQLSMMAADATLQRSAKAA